MPTLSGTQVAPIPCAAFTRRIVDFDQLATFFVDWRGRFEQVSAGRFEGALDIVSGRMLQLSVAHGNQAISLRGRGAPSLCSLYLVTRANAGGLWQGRRLTPGQFVVHGPATEANHCTARVFTSIGFAAGAEFMAAARSLSGEDAFQWPATWDALSPAPDAFHAVNDRMHRLLATTLADPALLATSEGGGMEQECIRTVVAALFPTTGRPALPLAARASLTRQVEDVMRAHLQVPLGAVDLCSAFQVSDRTLRLAFRERFGVGPMTYYRMIRLNAVRTALKADREAGVAEVARRFGFHHLGNFAADFRRLFGELPSAARYSPAAANSGNPVTDAACEPTASRLR